MNQSHLRGNKIVFTGNQWRYADTGEPTVETHDKRPCGHCGRMATLAGHDACLGTLPDVMNACCGHGHDCEAYVQLTDGQCVRGDEAMRMIDTLKGAS